MMPHHNNDPVDCVHLYLPPSHRGASRDLIIERSKFSLEAVLCGEAYAYRICQAYVASKNMYTADVTFHKEHNMGQMVWLGAIILLEDFDSDAWLRAFPKKYPPWQERKYYMSKFIDSHVKVTCLVVDRYGEVHKVTPIDAVEPIEWTKPPPPVAIITPKPGYDDNEYNPGTYML